MIFSVGLFIVSIISEINGHGRLMMPPSRNAMWRLGYPNPPDYNDNELNCGGLTVQYETNDGKCGICGDDYREPDPRTHEAGGPYANGIIGMTYGDGEEIEIEVDITANHQGWMEIKICVNNDPSKEVTQECLNQYPLNVVGGQDGTRFYIPADSPKAETFKWTAKLPDGMTCSQCVIQWTYFGGNNWGTCANGTEGMGCGPQETFINCADVAIGSVVNTRTSHNVSPWTLYYRGNIYDNVVKKNDDVSEEELKPLVIRSQLCIPIGENKEEKGMDDYCRINCLKYPPSCPAEKCKCVHDCVALGEFAKSKDADFFCNKNCLQNPSSCDEEKCKCN